MAAQHGTRTKFNAGCKCDACKQANRAYFKARRRKQEPAERKPAAPRNVTEFKPRIPNDPPVEREPGVTEAAVMAEIAGLSTAEQRPGLVAVALAHARVLDDPLAISQHASNGHRLAEALDKLRKGADARTGRLASVRSIGKQATG